METKATFSRSSHVLQPNLSVYLDLLRYFAALMVYLFHADHFANYRLPFFGTYGGLGVAVFSSYQGSCESPRHLTTIPHSTAALRQEFPTNFL